MDFSFGVGDIVLNLARTMEPPPLKVAAEPAEEDAAGSPSPAGSSPRAGDISGMATDAPPPAEVPLESVVGEVLRCSGGRVWVHWVDGSETAVLPGQVGHWWNLALTTWQRSSSVCCTEGATQHARATACAREAAPEPARCARTWARQGACLLCMVECMPLGCRVRQVRIASSPCHAEDADMRMRSCS